MTDIDIEFDETKAVEFIRQRISPALSKRLSDDDIIYFIDLMFDYYDSRGFFDEEDEEEQEIDIDLEELTEYVIKNAKRDEIGSFNNEEVLSIIEAEMDYEDTFDQV